jgi:hypothetical protein
VPLLERARGREQAVGVPFKVGGHLRLVLVICLAVLLSRFLGPGPVNPGLGEKAAASVIKNVSKGAGHE